MNAVENRIRVIRRKRKLSQEQLAELLGVRQTAVSRVERSGAPRADTLLRYARALRVDVGELIA